MNNEIVTSYVSLEVEDGTQMSSYCARPQAKGPLPCILVFQEIFGVNCHIRAVVERFASQGFMALAPELFHRTAPPAWEGDYGNYTSVLPHTRALTIAQSEADLRACYQWMRQQPEVDIERMYAIGFSLGGRIAFLANATLPLRAAASFYGGRIAPGLLDRAAAQHGPILLIWGGRDAHITAEQRRAVGDALAEAKKSYVEVLFADAEHGFFCDDRKNYDDKAARASWGLLGEFLEAR